MRNPELGTIYIEGSDCAGKDVVGKVIAGEYGITNIQKLALHSNNPWNVDKTHELTSEHPLFPAYLLRSIIWDIRHYDPMLPNRKQLQLSFTGARSAAWCKTSNNGLTDIFMELLKFSPLFEHSFLLSASVEVKQDRLIRRVSEGGASSHIDRLIFTNPDFVVKMDEIMEKIVCQEMGSKIVKTDNLNIDEVGKVLIASIDEESISIHDNGRRLMQAEITPELGRFHREIVSYSDAVAKKYGLPGVEIEKVQRPFMKNEKTKISSCI